MARSEAVAAGGVVGGRYTVTASIAVDSAAATYRATLPPNRLVVLKVYSPTLGGPATEGLRRAAASTMDLPRGTTLQVLEVGVDAELGATFVATELSAWPSLSHLVELCPLSGPDASVLAASIARAIEPAHARGLVHLGLKPNNLFVGPAPAYDVRLADFSATLARAALGAAEDPAVTSWLAPEQAHGGPAAGPAADVFSAALVVFFALTGHPYGSVRGAPASARAAQYGIWLAAAWDAPFARALHVDPAHRYRSVTQLADAFARAARGEPPLEPPVVDLLASDRTPPMLAALALPVEEAAPARRSSRMPQIVAGAVGGLALLGVALFLSWRWHQAPPVAPVAATTAPPATPSTLEPLGAHGPPAPVAPVPPASPVPARPGVDHDHALLVVTCTPACDSVWVDGHPAPHAAEGMLLPPGVHMVGANLARHPSTVRPILLRRGEVHPFEVDFGR